jgi:hypothetical protein
MKFSLLSLLLILSLFGLSQQHYLPNMDKDVDVINMKAGSCASPDGNMLEIPAFPPNHQYLNDNGYCLYSYPTTSTFTACFTFVAGSSSVDVNAGYSESCNSEQFSNFRLFNSSCVQIATGLSFSGLTPGQTYTWCLNMRAWGGPSCNGFSTFCPYFLNISTLPIELYSFTANNDGDYNLIKWTTASESNNDVFLLDYSTDGLNWRTIIELPGAGNSTNKIDYSFRHYDFANTINYYRLTQIDFDGKYETFHSVSVDNRIHNKHVTKIINLMGQEVEESYNGVIIIIYSDGTSEKKIHTK